MKILGASSSSKRRQRGATANTAFASEENALKKEDKALRNFELTFSSP